MRTIFIIYAFFCIFFIQKLHAQECKYAEYYSLTDVARKHYFNKNYKGAKKIFQLAFSKIDFPLGHDLSFALVSAIKTKDDFWAREIAEKLAKGGIPLRYFVKYKREKWYKEFEVEFENYTKYYNENYNQELRSKIILLLKKDEEYTEKYHKWRTREIELSLKELIDGRLEILTEFEQIVSKYDFPNEKLMGYNYLRRKNTIEPYNIEILIVHIYQTGVFYLKNDISNIICDGGLAPNYEEILQQIQKFSVEHGIEKEMKERYIKFRGR